MCWSFRANGNDFLDTVGPRPWSPTGLTRLYQTNPTGGARGTILNGGEAVDHYREKLNSPFTSFRYEIVDRRPAAGILNESAVAAAGQ